MSGACDPRLIETERRDAAADWLQRLPDRAMSESDLQEWLQWYADEENRRAFDRTQTFYRQLRGMNDRQRVRLRAALPDAHVLSAEKRISSSVRFSLGARGAYWALSACLILAVVTAVSWQIKTPQVRVYEAPMDRYRAVQLTDGSKMVLSARGVASVAYDSKARLLDVLQGAVYFEVKRDPQRPFVVRAGDISVTAIGTAFSVTREANRLSVTVTEGSVDVARSASASDPRWPPRLRLNAGGRTSFAVAQSPSAPGDVPADPAQEWKDGSIQFFNTPLGQVVKAVNVHARTHIFIEDPRVTDLNYSGTVFRERIDEWVAALPAIYPVRNVMLDDGTMTLVLRSPASARN